MSGGEWLYAALTLIARCCRCAEAMCGGGVYACAWVCACTCFLLVKSNSSNNSRNFIVIVIIVIIIIINICYHNYSFSFLSSFLFISFMKIPFIFVLHLSLYTSQSQKFFALSRIIRHDLHFKAVSRARLQWRQSLLCILNKSFHLAALMAGWRVGATRRHDPLMKCRLLNAWWELFFSLYWTISFWTCFSKSRVA